MWPGTAASTAATATAGWYGRREKDFEAAVCRETSLHQSSVQLASLSAVVDVKSVNKKSATPDWRNGGSPGSLL